ncbi:uncharacterized protein LOC119587564 [Penaeus monodon]|uniref:uncharacterized protein LOC119587564 n=1 Tax=Penaeus monodon TaxID=6687 RepID=UPI0018A791FC|nr:uncharacterized protein LOC119587564 [Penaeus monodon]
MFEKVVLVVACTLAVQVSSQYQDAGDPSHPEAVSRVVERLIYVPIAELLALRKRGAGMPRPDPDSRIMKRENEVPLMERLVLLRREPESGMMERESGPESDVMERESGPESDMMERESEPESNVMERESGPESDVMERQNGPESVGMLPKRFTLMDIHDLATRDAGTQSPQHESGIAERQAGPPEMDSSMMPGSNINRNEVVVSPKIMVRAKTSRK